MITREQLINKVISAVPLDDISITKDAVDEYTQQEAIAFAKWVDDERYYWGLDNMWTSVNDKEPRSDEQLYQLYKNKDK